MKLQLNPAWSLTDEAPAPHDGKVYLVNENDQTAYTSTHRRLWNGRPPIQDAYEFAVRLAVSNCWTCETLEVLDRFDTNITPQ